MIYKVTKKDDYIEMTQFMQKLIMNDTWCQIKDLWCLKLR